MKSRTREEFISYLEELKLGPADWMKEVLTANHGCAINPGGVWIPADLPACEVMGTSNVNSGDSSGEGVLEIDTSTLESLMVPGWEEQMMILDVRDVDEYDRRHIKGSLNIPLPQLTKRLDELNKNVPRRVVTVCQVGGRSRLAAVILQGAGFGDVVSLTGGMRDWFPSGEGIE